MVKTQQYGTWSSPISPALRANEVTFYDVQWHIAGTEKTLVWVERRGGQGVLVTQSGADAPYDLSGNFSVRGSAGYGGGEFDTHDGQVYFVADGRIYTCPLEGGRARPIVPGFGGAASPKVSPDGQWVAFVHTYEDVDGIALVDADGKDWARKIAFDTDFVMSPAWHPNNKQLAYVGWNHPNMPWDGTMLRVITFNDDMRVIDNALIAGSDSIAISQPEFSPDGRYLAYLSDETGTGQIYLYELASGEHHMITDGIAEHATPAWVQGIRQYGWIPDASGIIYLKNQGGIITLWKLDLLQNTHSQLAQDTGFTSFQQVSVAPDGMIAVIASSSEHPAQIVTLSPSDETQVRRHTVHRYTVHRRALNMPLSSAYLSTAEAITWQGHDGETVHGLYYPPKNPQYSGEGAPPLIVHIHGGPTSQTRASFDSEFQFYTSRGFALLSVNYRGSTGYGRDYMLKLRENWGLYDVEDAASGADFLVSQGKADPDKRVIMGSSAGGYTVLQSLVDKPGFYKAAICKYGVSNQFMLVQDTHKFERHYSDLLLGVLPAAADLYRARSPLYHADKIVDPIIIFQGEDDPIVPRNQSDTLVKSLVARGVPHAYHVFAGEGHGFRKPETLTAYGKAVLEFLQQYVLFS